MDEELYDQWHSNLKTKRMHNNESTLRRDKWLRNGPTDWTREGANWRRYDTMQLKNDRRKTEEENKGMDWK